MCTAITFYSKDHYFGRNLDLEYSLGEAVVITPTRYPLKFRHILPNDLHYAIIGIGLIEDNYPLYYDAVNEYGLSAAGLNFPGNAIYCSPCESKVNIASFELIPWILSQFKSVQQVKDALATINITNDYFSPQYAPTPLHWMIADQKESIVLEATYQGIQIYENPVGVLTNNPPFEYHIHNLSNYLNVSREEAVNRFLPGVKLEGYSRGLGGAGLPGDLSSGSRFVRAAFTKHNSVLPADEGECVSQFFHILGSAEQQEGCVRVRDQYEKTVYSSCCNIDRGIYYYKTYHNSSITSVDLFHEDLESTALISYPLQTKTRIYHEN